MVLNTYNWLNSLIDSRVVYSLPFHLDNPSGYMRATIVHLFLALVIAPSAMIMAQSSFQQAKDAADLRDYVGAVDYVRQALREDPKDEDVLALATKIYLELDLLDTAELYGRRLYEIDDNNDVFVRTYSDVLTQNGKPLEAIRALRKLAKEDDVADVETSLYLVSALLAADSAVAAELVATTAKKQFPNSADAYLALGTLYFNYQPRPVYELAVQNYEQAVSLDSNLVDAHFGLAECYWKLANRESDKDLANELFTRSLREWNVVGRLDPRNARAWFEQGKIFYLSKRYQDAVKTLLRYRELRPLGTGLPIASWYLGKSFYELKACDSATVHLTNAANSIDSLKSQAALMLARCSFLAKNWAEASMKYGQAVASGIATSTWDPSDVWYYGSALILSGDTTNAIRVMHEAASFDPKQCMFMFRFGLLLNAKLQHQASTQIFRQRLTHCSDSLNGRIHLFIGNNFFADSLLDSAVVAYTTSLSIDPNNGFTQVRLAETYELLGKDSAAVALYEQVIKRGEQPNASAQERKDAVNAIVKVNSSDYKQSKWDAIQEHCDRGLKLDPNNKWLRLYKAIAYQGAGDTEGACKWYRKVLEVDSSNTMAQKNLSALGC